LPAGWVLSSDDCDDTHSDTPGPELCDGRDNNCDTHIDEGVTTTYYADSDGDGLGAPNTGYQACQAPSAHFVTNANDCDDGDAAVGGVSSWYPDADGDGQGAVGSSPVLSCEPPDSADNDADCDDANPDVYDGAPEPCGVDEDRDCDGVAADWCDSCLDIRDNGERWGDGVYEIDIDGSAGPEPSSEVWCDMSTDGGGWTLVQRTVWNWSESSQLMTGRVAWYGTTIGDATLQTRAYRMKGSLWPYLNQELDHMLVHTLRQTNGLSCEPLYYVGSSGLYGVDPNTVTLTGLSSSVGMISATTLSTTDSGPSSSTCVTSSSQGVPWFYSSCCSTCPTYLGGYWADEPHPMQNYTDDTGDFYGNRQGDVCQIAVVNSAPSTSYWGGNRMEYYLR
ncbi:MAG: hypothetical protein JXX28_02890, partial [Deltaproteobacteria bacterium]|nr:hypothetical protein [Deltaproteobacteria bacterium]